jgi:hypothetical protein
MQVDILEALEYLEQEPGFRQLAEEARPMAVEQRPEILLITENKNRSPRDGVRRAPAERASSSSWFPLCPFIEVIEAPTICSNFKP